MHRPVTPIIIKLKLLSTCQLLDTMVCLSLIEILFHTSFHTLLLQGVCDWGLEKHWYGRGLGGGVSEVH